jgi:hypothetical protein
MTASGDHCSRPAPAAAPASMAATEPSRRCGRDPGPRASALSAVSPVRVSVSTVVVRSGAPRWRTVLFCTPSAAASTAMVANRPAPAQGSTPVPASTATMPRMNASAPNAAASQCAGRAAASVCAARPPASAPSTNPAMAMTEAAADSPECGSALNPRNTTLPVMLATNTRPSRR